MKAALERLRRFQATDGGFGYWPGDDDSADWATNYAGPLRGRGAEGRLPPAPGAARPVDGLPAPAGAGLGVGRGPGPGASARTSGADPGLPPLHPRPRRGARARRHEPAARAGRACPVTAKWRLAAAYQLAGQPEAARALATPGAGHDRALPRARRAPTGRTCATGRWCSRRWCSWTCAEHVGPLVKSLSRVALEERRGSAPRRRPTRCSPSRRRRPTRRATRRPPSPSSGAAAGRPRSRPPRPSSSDGSRSAKGAPKLVVRNTRHHDALPAARPLRAARRWGRRPRPRTASSLEVQYLPPRRQAARPVPPRPGHGLQGGGEGHEHRGARRLPGAGALARGRLGLGDPQRPPRPEPVERPSSAFEYQDVRDDRVYTYFDLKAGETKTVEVRAQRELPRPLLPAAGHGRGDVRRDPQRPGEGAVGRGGASPAGSMRLPRVSRWFRSRGQPLAASVGRASPRAPSGTTGRSRHGRDRSVRAIAAAAASRVGALLLLAFWAARAGRVVRRPALDGGPRPRRRAARGLDRGRRPVALRGRGVGAGEVRGRDHLLRGPPLRLAPRGRPARPRPGRSRRTSAGDAW